MLIKKILAAESLGMVHPERQSAKPGFGGVAEAWPFWAVSKAGPWPRCCALSASGLRLDIPTLQPRPVLALSRCFYFQVYGKDAFFWLSCSVCELQKLGLFPPQTLFLLPSHFLVDLFVPQRLGGGQEKHCRGAESDLQETWCVFLFRSLPIKKVSMDLLGSPFGRSGRKGGGISLLSERQVFSTDAKQDISVWTVPQVCSFGALGIFTLLSKQEQNTTAV